jgi:hypothetical protein
MRELKMEIDEDDLFPPGPNFLAQFRKPMSEEEIDEAAAEFEAALVAILQNEQD